MNEFWESLLIHLPPFFYTLASVIILAFLVSFAILVLLTSLRLYRIMNKETRIYELQEQLWNERDARRLSEAVASEVSTALENAQMFVHSFNNLLCTDDVNKAEAASKLIQRTIEMIPADIKNLSGERHRCGLWIQDDQNPQELVLAFASSGFPPHYLNNRRHRIDRSLAGKAFHRGITIKEDDVRKNDDWAPNPDSNSNYLSLICIPVCVWNSVKGVVTVDGLRPMRNEAVLIAEFYTRIIEGALIELSFAQASLVQAYNSPKESAATSEGGQEKQID